MCILIGNDSRVSPELAFQKFVLPVTNICGLVQDNLYFNGKTLNEISGKKLIAIIYCSDRDKLPNQEISIGVVDNKNILHFTN